MNEKDSLLRDGVVFRKVEKFEKGKQKSRIERLSPYKVSRLIPNLRISDYCVEAEYDFIYGCFRSCIICSATAAELSLKDALIFSSEDWEETYWRIETKKMTFGKLLEKEVKKVQKLKPILKEATWLKDVRNEIVAHPLYIGSFFDIKKPGQMEGRSLEHLIWSTRTMVRDIRKLLRLLGDVEPDKKKAIEEKPFKTTDDAGRILEEYSVKDFLNLRRRERYEDIDFLYWKVIQNELVEEIAFLAYTRMIRIVNFLFLEKR